MKQKTNNTTAGMKFWLLLVLTVLSLGQAVKAEVVYDNTTGLVTSGGDPVRYNQTTGYQIADEVVLGGNSRYLTNFSLEYYQSGIPAGATLRLRIYALDGAAYGTNFSAPGSLLYDSSEFTIGVNGDGYHTLTFNSANSGLAIPVSGSFAWSVEFDGVTTGTAGLALYTNPTTGSNYDQAWELADGSTSWVSRSGAYPLSFYAQAGAATVTDTVAPSIAVKGPADKFVTTAGPVITAFGEAKDAGGRVAMVLIRTGTGTYYPANLTSNAGKYFWTNTVTLSVGTNQFYAKAVDWAGNVATNKALTYVYVVFKPMTISLLQDGVVSSTAGTISPPYVTSSGTTNLIIGKIYSVQVAANKFYYLSNSILSISGTNVTTFANTAPKFNFTMATNLALTVNFATNRFFGIAGMYSGLFGEGNTNQDTSGYAALKISPGDSKNTWSASIYVGGDSTAVGGVFDLNGDSVSTESKPTKITAQTYVASVHVPFDGSDEITGWVSNTISGVVSDLSVDRYVWLDTGSAGATNYSGLYTMATAGDDSDPSTRPPGYASYLLNLGTDGKLVPKGVINNKEAVSPPTATYLSKSGKWPLYLTGSKDGNKKTTASVIGWLQFDNSPYKNISGTVKTIRTFNSIAPVNQYPAGFTNVVSLLAEGWTPPASYIIPLDSGTHLGTLTLSGGNLASDQTISLQANPTLSFTTLPQTGMPVAGPLKSVIKPNAATGMLEGSFNNPYTSVTGVKILGVFFQNANVGQGLFLGNSTSGKVLISTP